MNSKSLKCLKEYKDVENLSGLIENLKGCVSSINEIWEIITTMKKLDFGESGEDSDSWDGSIVDYYNKCSKEMRLLAYEVIFNYCKEEAEEAKEKKVKKQKLEKRVILC